jgi:hypothetical protein
MLGFTVLDGRPCAAPWYQASVGVNLIASKSEAVDKLKIVKWNLKNRQLYLITNDLTVNTLARKMLKTPISDTNYIREALTRTRGFGYSHDRE